MTQILVFHGRHGCGDSEVQGSLACCSSRGSTHKFVTEQEQWLGYSDGSAKWSVELNSHSGKERQTYGERKTETEA